MSLGQVRRDLERLVAKNSRLEIRRVGDDQALNFDLGFDSHALLNLLLDIEDTYGIEVPPEAVPEYVGLRFGDLVEKVAAHAGKVGEAK